MVPNESRSRRLRLQRWGKRVRWVVLTTLLLPLPFRRSLYTTNYRQHSLTFHSDYALIIITMATDAHWLRAVRSRGLPLPVPSNSQQTIWMFLSFPSLFIHAPTAIQFFTNQMTKSTLYFADFILLFCSLTSTLTYTFTFTPIHTPAAVFRPCPSFFQ